MDEARLERIAKTAAICTIAPALNASTVGIMVPVGVLLTIGFSRLLYKRGVL